MTMRLRTLAVFALTGVTATLALSIWMIPAMATADFSITQRTSGALTIADLRGLLPDTNFQMFDIDTERDVCLMIVVRQDIDGTELGEVDGQLGSFSRGWRCLKAGSHRLVASARREGDDFRVTVSVHDDAGESYVSGSSLVIVPAEFRSMTTQAERDVDLSSGEATLISWQLTENGNPQPGSREFIVRIEGIGDEPVWDDELEPALRESR